MELGPSQPIAQWDDLFALNVNALSVNQKTSPGGLLTTIPARDDWDCFKASVQSVWRVWELAFKGHPVAFVILYDGVAFYRYESGNFWKGFAQTVGMQSIGVAEQSRINQQYQLSASRIGLPVECGEYNSAAIRQIGVPVSMWEGVLGICEWALWQSGWREFSDQEWKHAITRRLGGRKRLIDFLVQNREAATEFIQEMLDARELLRENPTLTLAALKEVCRLRREYFEEVPETADFLREDDPESLFADRARLSWNDYRETLSLHLPAVGQSMLPAEWRFGSQRQPASNTAGELVVNGAAFTRSLRLELCRGGDTASQRIVGIEDWALWDETKARFVPRRDHLPLAQYVLISKQPLRPKLEGWACDPDDPCIDLSRELSDGTSYYVTRLVPESRRPRLKVSGSQWFAFMQRRGVVLRLFCGTNLRTASRFSLSSDGSARVEELPRPFLEVPLSLISDDHIDSEFDVFLDGRGAPGRWKTYSFKPDGTDETNAESALCFWHWEDMRLSPATPGPSVHRSLESIGRDASGDSVRSQLGRHSLHVQSRRLGRLPFGGKSQFDFDLVPKIAHVWPNSWGDYLVWILLSQVQDEASWEEVRFAHEALSYGRIQHHFVYYAIRKLERYDYLAIRGHRYLNFRNRIALLPTVRDELRARYCGLSTALYELVRAVPPLGLEVACTDAGKPPSLQLRWAARDRGDVRLACEQNQIEIVNALW